MENDNKVVQGMWIGGPLTNVQKLCIRSFLDHGHEFHLYLYKDYDGVPKGTVLKYADEIINRRDLTRVRYNAHFSDLFRSRLIYAKGGWYSDLDEICLHELDAETSYVFIDEYRYDGARRSRTETERLVNCCLFKAPKGCDLLAQVIDEQNKIDGMALPKYSIELGPVLFRKLIPACGLSEYIAPPEVYDALGPDELKGFTEKALHFTEPARTIHLRMSYWSPETGGFDPDATYPYDSLFETLKRKHGVAKESKSFVPTPALKSHTELEQIVTPYTMASPERIRLLIDLARLVESERVPGDMVECGVCNGGSAAILAHSAAHSRLTRTTWLFDSFEGLPAPGVEDGPAAKAHEGDCVGSIEKVKEVLALVGANMREVNIVMGWFDRVLPGIGINEIAMLNLDSDWYWSERLCLERLYPCVVPNGIVYFDDYFYWEGCRRAVDEFFAASDQPIPKFNRVDHSMYLQRGHY
jgi:O-methyltransferase